MIIVICFANTALQYALLRLSLLNSILYFLASWVSPQRNFGRLSTVYPRGCGRIGFQDGGQT